MKNIFKDIWSQWDTADKFVTIFSLVLLSLVMLSCTKCSAQETNDTIKDLEVYDASGEVFDCDLIPVAPVGVIDFIYCTQDNEYVVKYDDEDSFDPETSNMVYDRENGYYYIEIYCDSITFFEYLQYYNSLNVRKDSRFYKPSSTFFIEEDYLSDDTQYYKLVKYGKD